MGSVVVDTVSIREQLFIGQMVCLTARPTSPSNKNRKGDQCFQAVLLYLILGKLNI